MTEKEHLINLLQQAKDETCKYGGYVGVDTFADYLIANGVIAPPVKVGDVVYHIFSADNIKASIVKRIQHGKYGTMFADAHGVFDVLRVGNDIFLTEEEADAHKNTLEKQVEESFWIPDVSYVCAFCGKVVHRKHPCCPNCSKEMMI